jgi:hypothetical protein
MFKDIIADLIKNKGTKKSTEQDGIKLAYNDRIEVKIYKDGKLLEHRDK